MCIQCASQVSKGRITHPLSHIYVVLCGSSPDTMNHLFLKPHLTASVPQDIFPLYLYFVYQVHIPNIQIVHPTCFPKAKAYIKRLHCYTRVACLPFNPGSGVPAQQQQTLAYLLSSSTADTREPECRNCDLQLQNECFHILPSATICILCSMALVPLEDIPVSESSSESQSST